MISTRSLSSTDSDDESGASTVIFESDQSEFPNNNHSNRSSSNCRNLTPETAANHRQSYKHSQTGSEPSDSSSQSSEDPPEDDGADNSGWSRLMRGAHSLLAFYGLQITNSRQNPAVTAFRRIVTTQQGAGRQRAQSTSPCRKNLTICCAVPEKAIS